MKTKAKHTLIVLVLAAVFLLLLNVLSYWHWIKPICSHKEFSVPTRMQTALNTLWFAVGGESLVLLVLRALLALGTALNAYLIYLHLKYLKKVSPTGSVWATLSVGVASFFSGCIGCATSIFAPILSFLGLGSVVAALPFKGKELLGIFTLFVWLNTYFLWRKYKKGISC